MVGQNGQNNSPPTQLGTTWSEIGAKLLRGDYLSALRLIFAWILVPSPGSRAPAIFFLILLLLIVLPRMAGLDTIYWLPSKALLSSETLDEPVLRDMAAVEDTKKFRRCTAAARAARQNYLIVSLFDYNSFEFGADAKETNIKHRIAYTILPLKDWGASVQGFDESYGTEGISQDWGGPYNESGNLNKKRSDYYLYFDAKWGDPMIIVTGINSRVPIRAGPVKYHGRSLNPDQDYYHYPSGKDELCTYSAVFDSQGDILQPNEFWVESEDSQKPDTKISVRRKDLNFQDGIASTFSNSSFAVEASGVPPGQNLHVTFSFSPTAPSSPASGNR